MPAPPGHYVSSEGAAEAVVCPEGTYCPEGSVTPVDCPAGHYCPAGAGEPAPCPTGTYSAVIGLSAEEECLLCPPGYYCDHSEFDC